MLFGCCMFLGMRVKFFKLLKNFKKLKADYLNLQQQNSTQNFQLENILLITFTHFHDIQHVLH